MNPNKGRTVQKTSFLDITLADGSRMQAKVFVPIQGRLIDVLNDERQFLPVETVEGDVVALAKTTIKQVTLPRSDATLYAGNDPYAILNVRPGTSADEIKRIYHELSMANHPDRIKSFGLGADFLDLATKNMARINSAYAQILKTIN
jgi:DnaJ-domain-containing protein 1